METLTKEFGLSVLDKRESKLIELADKYKDLKIKGAEDKDGYKKVREARIELKNERVAVENDAYALRENAIKFQKAVITREKQLVGIISSTEKTLQDEEDKYKKEIEAIRVEKERKEQERIQNRINALAKFNYAIDLYDASTMLDDKFNELLSRAEVDYKDLQEQIAQAKADEERKRKEEAEQLEQQRKELAKQKAESIAQAEAIQKEYQEHHAAVKAERAKMDAERAALAEEQRKHQEQIRLEQAKKEAAEKSRIEAEQKAEREAKEKIERERLEKLETERRELLKPDKEKLYAVIDFCAKQKQSMNTDDGQRIIDRVSNYIKEEIAKL